MPRAPEGAAGLVPVFTLPTPEVIADQLRRRIVDGSFAPGAQLAEVALATRLGVSRGPVREAMARLIQEGLLVNVRNRGVFVVELGPRDVVDIYEARRAVERFAAIALRIRGDAATYAQLDALVEEMAGVVEAGEPAALVELDLRFHETLVASADSPRLIRMFATLAAETRICLVGLLEHYPQPGDIAREHRDLVRVLRGGREADVLAALDEHLDSAVRLLTSTG